MLNKPKRKLTPRQLMLVSFGSVLASGLFLIFGLILLIGREKKDEAFAENNDSQTRIEENIDGETTEDTISDDDLLEDPETSLDSEEEGAEVEIGTIKEVENETDDITVGIDVSWFQENIDWEQVAESGIDFAMVRIGYRTAGTGEIKEDQCAKYNLQEAGANGIHLGAYFFSTAVTEEEAREEAMWVKEFLSGYSMTYPIVYNCEGFQEESSRQHNLTIEERSNFAKIFLDEIEKAGYTGMFYAAKGELLGNMCWDTDGLEQRFRIWVAQYPDPTYPEISNPDYTGKYAMWQYTDQGRVPGISTVVDLNVAYFGYSEAASAKEDGAAEHVEADLEVGVTFEEVNEQVTSKDVTNLRSSMDQGDDSNVVTQLKNGETAIRTGKGNNGWSRVEYNDQILYAVSSYLTTDLTYTPPVKEPDDGFKTKFTSVIENVTAKEVTNLRNRPSVEEPSQVIVELHNGEVIVRTGVSELGWSRVKYNGQTLYCISSYLQVVE